MNRMVTAASQKGRKEKRRSESGRLRNGSKNQNTGKANDREGEKEGGGERRVVVSDRVLVESKIRECDLQQAMVGIDGLAVLAAVLFCAKLS